MNPHLLDPEHALKTEELYVRYEPHFLTCLRRLASLDLDYGVAILVVMTSATQHDIDPGPVICRETINDGTIFYVAPRKTIAKISLSEAIEREILRRRPDDVPVVIEYDDRTAIRWYVSSEKSPPSD